jgi:predicted transcriptional regulator
MNSKHQLASLQLAIMQVLWEKGEASVAEVRDALAKDRALAYTTVATMLTKMERKGQVLRRSDRRINLYRPAVEREKVSRSMVSDLTRRLFQGDVAAMVSHLLDGRSVTREELAHLKAVIRAKEKELESDAGN